MKRKTSREKWFELDYELKMEIIRFCGILDKGDCKSCEFREYCWLDEAEEKFGPAAENQKRSDS